MSQVLTIRAAGPADLGEVDTLLRRAFPRLLKGGYPPSAMVTAVPLLLQGDPAQLAGGRHWVAQDGDGRIIGAGGWAQHRRRWSAPRTGALRQFVTDPDFVRCGVGGAIMEEAIGDARAARLTHLSCQSTLNAVPFYAAFGFESQGRRRMALAQGIDFVFEQMVRAM